MPTDPQPPGVLALLGNPAPMQPLLDHLRQLGMVVDVASDLASARALFFGAGGHDCLVIAPDVKPGLVRQVVQSLRSVDPELPMATFGREPGQPQRRARDAVLGGFHPGSRAGTGALVRFLRGMQRRA